MRKHSFNDDSRGPRLQKVMADLGVDSRRNCEALIEQGDVTVNGERVDSLPAWVDPQRDRIEVGGRLVNAHRDRPIVIMLNKPRGTVCTNSDPEGRPRAIDLVRLPGNPRLYSVGRLDLDSSGLLLLTNDGELANRLTHPSYEVHKGYEVLVGGRLEDEEVKLLEEGVFLPERPKSSSGSRGSIGPDGAERPSTDPPRAPKGRPSASAGGKRTSGAALELLRRDRDRTLLYLELREGRNRQVRRMLLDVGHPVKRLKRVRMGPLELKGLAVGEWRELTSSELRALRSAAGLERPQTRERSATKPARRKADAP